MDRSLAPTSGFTLSCAATLEDLQRIENEWAGLFSRCPDATAFQSPCWLIPWARHLGNGEFQVLCLRAGTQLIAVAPFMIEQRPDETDRRLVLLGTGNTDYLDILAEPGLGETAAALFLEDLHRHNHSWDVCDFQQLRPGSPLLAIEVAEHWSSELMVQEVCPVLPLGNKGGPLSGLIPRHMSEKLSYYRKRAARDYSVSFQVAAEDTLDELFRSFLALHALRWQGKDETGMLRDDRVQAFHAEVCRGFLKANSLRLYVLRLNDRAVAALYAFSSHGTTFHYLGGFDPEYSALSPGSLLIGHAIERAIAEGCREFDFLRGREAYKYMWGAKGRLNCRRRLRLNPKKLPLRTAHRPVADSSLPIGDGAAHSAQ